LQDEGIVQPASKEVDQLSRRLHQHVIPADGVTRRRGCLFVLPGEDVGPGAAERPVWRLRGAGRFAAL